MNTKANFEAIRDRMQEGERPSRFRAAVIGVTAGSTVAVVVYRLLREETD